MQTAFFYERRSQGADYDTGGQNNFAVFRPAAGAFFHLNNWTGQTVYTLWGTNGDIPPVAGDNIGNHFMVFARRKARGTDDLRGAAPAI